VPCKFFRAPSGIAVLDIIESQSLMENAKKVEEYFMEAIKITKSKVKGRGLMLGVEFDFDVSALKKNDC
jgi:acetylornithine aminotransferase